MSAESTGLQPYQGLPSCTVCKVDYLGTGTCGACLYVSRLLAEQAIFRQLLWWNHLCPQPALYGDDGELQCHSCGSDFVRDSAAQIEAKFIALANRDGS